MRYVLFAALAAIALLATSTSPIVAQQGITIQQVLQSKTTVTGQPIEFPHLHNQASAVLTELAPGGQTGNTTVFFPSVVYEIDGTLSVEMPGQPATGISAGQALVAPLRTSFNAANRDSTAARFLTVSFGEQGKPFVERIADTSQGFRTTTVLQTAKTWSGEPILFPLSANQFTVLSVRLAPGAANARHVHPPTEFIYVLNGTSSVEPSESPSRIFKQGQGFVETIVPHVGANRGAVNGRVLIVFAGEAGVPLSVPMP